MADICWRHSGQRLILPVAVLPSVVAANHQQMHVVEALIDTGATGTGLRSDIADILAIPGRGKRRVMTANGDILVAEFRIRLGFFPGNYQAEAEAEPATLPYVLELGILAHALRAGFSYPLLLGMDVLSQCDLDLRRDGAARLTLP